ncbi:MAG: type II toxin-antitoxin system RelE/ParE family toxin, partial [Xanthobacteraceae bacterium]
WCPTKTWKHSGSAAALTEDSFRSARMPRPRRGSQQTDDPTLRVKVVVGYRYKILYRIREDIIEIVHVRHTSRRPWIGP